MSGEIIQDGVLRLRCPTCETKYKVRVGNRQSIKTNLQCKRCGGSISINIQQKPGPQETLPRGENAHSLQGDRQPQSRHPASDEFTFLSASGEIPATEPTTDNKISESDYVRFIGKNADNYLHEFKKFHTGNLEQFRFTWHWPAFFIPPFWFMYRKLYLWMVVSFCLGVVPFLGLFSRFIWGATAYYLYYKNAREKILLVKTPQAFKNASEAGETLRRAGGINLWPCLFVPIPIIGILAAVAVPQFAFYRARAYDQKAQTYLGEMVTAQKEYHQKHQTYADSISDLIKKDDSQIDAGITVHILSADADGFSMKAFHQKGRRLYMVNGPHGKIISLFRDVQDIFSSTGDFKVPVPSNWSRMAGLNEDADLEVGNTLHDCYLVVIAESEYDLPSIDLQKYAEVTEARFLENLLDAESKQTPMDSLNSLPAIQYKIKGTLPGNRAEIVYLLTLAKGKSTFYQIIGWTTRTRFAQNKDELNTLIRGFTEL